MKKINKINISIIAILILSVAALQPVAAQEIIGRSVEDRPIASYTIRGRGPVNPGSDGTADMDLLLIGGIHGGYEWNTVVLARNLLEHYMDTPEEIPSNLNLHIIPVLNPDGLYRIAGTADPKELDPSSLQLSRDELRPGRLNGNMVDLNRNFDNGWQSTGYHGFTEVSAGSDAFSEPESRLVRDLVQQLKPEAVIFLHSASNNIWYGGLPDSWEPAKRLAEAYSAESGYSIVSLENRPASRTPFTGTASGYLYEQGVPAIIIELANRYDPATARNIRGLNALMRTLP